MTERLQRLLDLAAARGLRGVILVPGPSLFYLTGLSFHLSERLTLALFTTGGKAALVLPALEAEKAAAMRTFPYDDVQGPTEALHRAALPPVVKRARVSRSLRWNERPVR